jgi:glycosyltransferase involved in cell wall biosynthesis
VTPSGTSRPTDERGHALAPAIHVDVHPALVPGGGIGRFANLLIRALSERPGAPDHRFVVARSVREEAHRRWPRERVVELPWTWRELAIRTMAGRWLGWRFDAEYGHPAVVHSTAGYGPRFAHTRLINHVHDITAYTNPEWHIRKTRALQVVAAPVACRSAALVLTDCEWVRGEVIRHFHVAPERVLSVPLPLDPEFRPMDARAARAHVARTFGLDGPFVLHVSTLEPRKNVPGLVAAWERMRHAGFPGPLILVGGDGWHMRPILARLESSPFASEIRRLRGIADQDLVALYSAATVTAFPSLAEGFGYPLLESMACGTPCVCSDHASLVELAAGAAPHAPATDADALADSMLRVWRDTGERERLAAAGVRRAADFAFEPWAERMFAIYRRELALACGGTAESARPAVP